MAKTRSAQKGKNNVVQYGDKKKDKKNKPINVGFIIFVIIAIYIIGHTGMFLFREKTSMYRVVSDEKSEVINTTGLALRNEKIIRSTEAGYINYYVNGNSRVRKNEMIFSIDKTGSIYSQLSFDNQTDEAGERLTDILHQFQINRDDNFFSTYSLKESMNEMVMTSSSKMVMATLKKSTEDNEFFNVNYASDSGIIVYGVDGLEELTEDKITPEIFENSNNYLLKTASENDGKVATGEPIYKLISDEVWNVVVPITENQKILLADKNYVEVIVDNKGFTAKAQARIDNINNKDYLVLTFFNYMSDYADKRFVNIYIVLKSISGLKIPKSAVIERQVYEIPDEFYAGGGGNMAGGFSIQTINKHNKVDIKYVETDICYRDPDAKLVYVDANEGFKSGDVIVEPNSGNTYTISKTKLLKGVYNINDGYPRFKHIEPDTDNTKSDNSEYYLIPTDKGYYLKEYDNIILNADRVTNNKTE